MLGEHTSTLGEQMHELTYSPSLALKKISDINWETRKLERGILKGMKSSEREEKAYGLEGLAGIPILPIWAP